MIFDEQFQLVQLLRTFAHGPVSAVAFDPARRMIAAGYDDRVELFSLSDSADRTWKRLATFTVDFAVTALDWSCNVCGDKIALYQSTHYDKTESSSAWIPLLVKTLAPATRIRRAQFSPNGHLLATFETGKCLMKVWSIMDFTGSESLREAIGSMLGRPFMQGLDLLSSLETLAFSYLPHDAAIAGFCWSPMARFKLACVLMTWTLDGMFTLWVPEASEKHVYAYHIIRSFEAKAAWFSTADGQIVLNMITADVEEVCSFVVESLEAPRNRLVKLVRLGHARRLPEISANASVFMWEVGRLLVCLNPADAFVKVLERAEDTYGESFTWNFAAVPTMPLQIISPYSMLAASVFPRTASKLDVCVLGPACSIVDCVQVAVEGEIQNLQWIASGHAFIGTSAGYFAVTFSESPLEIKQMIQVHSKPDLTFIGMMTGTGLALFWDKAVDVLHKYRVDFATGTVVCLEKRVLEESYGFMQLLDFKEYPHLIVGDVSLQKWHHIDDLYSELVYETGKRIRFARTSIFGDIALVSPRTETSDMIVIVTPANYYGLKQCQAVGTHDSILAMKWVVIDHPNYIRHLIVCTVTGIVVYVAAENDEFEEMWHAIDLHAFPAVLSPPIPCGLATISCNKFLDIWISLDEFIVMLAPVEDSPVWDALRNALEPTERTFETSEFYTRFFAMLLDANAPSKLNRALSFDTSSGLLSNGSVEAASRNYDFLSFDSTEDALTSLEGLSMPYKDTLAPSLGGLAVANEALDGPGRKFVVLNGVRKLQTLQLDGLDYLCAFLSDAQDSLVAECLQAPLDWRGFSGFGLAFWLRNTTRLGDLIESVCRTEYAKCSSSLEFISLFYLLVGKRRALQALWRVNQSGDPAHSRIAPFLARDFSDEATRLVASKNAYASLSKQKHRLAIMFFLLAEQVKDALQVALDALKDLSLAMMIARLKRCEPVLLELVYGDDRWDVCVRGILASYVGRSTDIIGTCMELARSSTARPNFPLLTALTHIKLPSRHRLTMPEAEQDTRLLLRFGAFEQACRLIDSPHLDELAEKASHLAILRLNCLMASRHWEYLKMVPMAYSSLSERTFTATLTDATATDLDSSPDLAVACK